MKNNRDILLAKLDEFIRKYYLNKLMKGCLISIFLFLLYVLLVLYSEYFIFFSSEQKSFFIILGIIVFIITISVLILLPLSKLFSLGKRISYEKAVQIISQHFSHIDDKLINTLELSNQNTSSNALLEASIDKRIASLQTIQFTKAVNLKRNYKYLIYLAVILFLGFSVYLYEPQIYTDSVERMTHYDKDYQKASRFQFQLLNTKLIVEKGQNFEVKLKILGEEIPEQVYILFGNNKYLLKQESSSEFSYLLHHVNSAFNFNFIALDEKSINYKLDIFSPPILSKLNVRVIAPAYTRMLVENHSGVGDISMPKGSRIEWNVSCIDADSLFFIFGKKDNLISSVKIDANFTLKRNFFQSTKYKLLLSNSEISNLEVARYNIDIIPDIYPEISITELVDSLNPNIKYFKGLIRDDYGFSSLNFIYSLGNDLEKTIPVDINNNSTSQEFYFSYDFTSLDYNESSKMDYFFRVGDNDAVNGVKYSDSEKKQFLYPNSKEIFEQQNEVQEQLSDKFDKSIKLNEEIREDIQNLQENLITGEKSDWQKQEAVTNIDNKRKQLEELLKSINKSNIDKNKLQNTFNAQDSSFLAKQKQIEELMEKLMDDELQKLMDEFQKLSQEFDKDKFDKMKDKMDMSYEDLDKQMQRNLDMLKKYDVELQFLSLAKRFDDLAKKEDNLANNLNKTENKKEQLEKNKQELESIKEDFDKLKQKNYSLKDPFQPSISPLDFEKLNELQEQADSLVENKKDKKAAGKLRHSASKMREMAQDLRKALEESNEDQVSINIESLKKILNDLIQFSFDQEEMIYVLKKVSVKSPNYSDLLVDQSLQNEKYKSIQDSLYSLASKSPQLAELLDHKVLDIKINLKEIDVNLADYKSSSAVRLQQYVMTTANDLALLLADGLENMKENQKKSGDCKSGCKKPGSKPGGKPGDKPGKKPGGEKKGLGLKSMKEGQESLKKMMKRMISQMKEAKGKGEGKGKKGNMMKQMSKMLQGHEMYRNSIQKVLEKSSMGKETDKILKQVLKMLEQTEQDISNLTIGKQTIMRQEMILTKLLEAENAEQERDIDKKRESKSVINHKIRNPREIFKYTNKTHTYKGVLKNSNVKLRDYYKKLYLDYIINLNNE